MKVKPSDDGDDTTVGEEEGDQGEEVDQTEEGEMVDGVHHSGLHQTSKLSTFSVLEIFIFTLLQIDKVVFHLVVPNNPPTTIS